MKDYDFSSNTNTRIGFSNRLGANAADQADALAERLSKDEWLTVRIPLIGGEKDGTPELHDGTRTVGKVSLRAVHLLEEAGTLREASRSPFRRTLTYSTDDPSSDPSNEPDEEPAMPDAFERITLSEARERLGIKPSTLENYVAPSSGPILQTEGRGKDRRVVVDEEFERRESAYLESLEDEPVNLKVNSETAPPSTWEDAEAEDVPDENIPEASGDGQDTNEPFDVDSIVGIMKPATPHGLNHPVQSLIDEAARLDADPLKGAGDCIRAAHHQATRINALAVSVCALALSEAYNEHDPLPTLARMLREEVQHHAEDLRESDRAATITAHRMNARVA